MILVSVYRRSNADKHSRCKIGPFGVIACETVT